MDGQTDRQTDRQTTYIPMCAAAYPTLKMKEESGIFSPQEFLFKTDYVFFSKLRRKREEEVETKAFIFSHLLRVSSKPS